MHRATKVDFNICERYMHVALCNKIVVFEQYNILASCNINELH